MKAFGIDLEKYFTKRKVLFLMLFSAFALISYQFNFSTILGLEKNETFTFFQFMGPIGAGIFDPFLGAFSVLLVEVANFLMKGTIVDLSAPAGLFTIARFFPMVFAAIYFGSKTKNTVVIPLICIALFIIHPVGGQAWLYSLYWLIPVLAIFWKDNLFIKSVGTTLTAHAVGSIAFLYLFSTTPAFWLALIPVVAFERLSFAIGITLSYVGMNTALDVLSHKVDLGCLHIDQRYAFLKGKATA
jgi:hypothetical protein